MTAVAVVSATLPDMQGRLLPTPYVRHYHVFDVPMRFATNAVELLEMADAAFGGFGQPLPEVAPRVHVTCLVHQPPPGATDGPPWPPPLVRGRGDTLLLTTGGYNIAMIDVGAARALAYVTPAMMADRDRTRMHFVETLGYYPLTRMGYVALHAACIVWRNQTLLLAAPAGTGKTTLAYAAVRRGWQLVAEDVIFVHPNPAGGLDVWGNVPWTLYLLPESLRFFPELTDNPVVQRPNGEWKVQVNLREMRRDASRPLAAPGPILLLERHDGADTVIEPVPADYVLTHYQFYPHQEEPEILAQVEGTVRDLLRHVPCYRVRLGDDLNAAVDALQALAEALPNGH